MASFGTYSVVRYASDPIRAEWTNLGVIVASDEESCLEVKFADSLTRRGLSKEDQEFVKPFQSRFLDQGVDLPQGEEPQEVLTDLVHDMQNSIQLTTPRACKIEDPQETLDYLYGTFVAIPEPPRSSYGRRPLLRSIKTTFREHDLLSHLDRNQPVQGRIGTHKIDFQVTESTLFVHGLPLPTTNETDFVDTVAQWEGKIPDILDAIGEGTLELVIQLESIEGDLEERARHGEDLLEESGASIVEHDEMDVLVEDVENAIRE